MSSGRLHPVLAAALLGAAACTASGPAIGQAREATPGPLTDLTVLPPVPKDYKPGRTAWGEPDFRGTWPLDHLNFTPFQRPPEQGNRVFLTDADYAARVKQLGATAERYRQEEEAGKMGMGHWVEPGTPNRRTSFLVDPANGRLPEKTEEGKRRSALMRSSYRPGQTFDSPADFDSWDRCITRGMPASMFPFNYNSGIRIFQAPGLVVLQLEMVHEVRVIPTDGRAAPPAQIRNWLGASRGHWEDANTLVVETTNLKTGPSATNVGTWGSPPMNDTPVSDQARIVERFTMTGENSIVYEINYSDPIIFTLPWSARVDWQRDEAYEIFEYACHEGNVQIRNYITSSRAQRAVAGEVSE